MIRVDSSILKLDRDELYARMMCNDNDTVLPITKKCEKEIRLMAKCSYSFRKSEVKVNHDTVSLDFCSTESKGLAQVLKDCDSAYIVAVTLGNDVDRLLRQKSVMSTTEHFSTDAVASALCESLCDYVQNILPQKTTRRFSPGYSDLTLNIQAPLLKFLYDCEIRLTESGLMIPSKSVTFIAGVKE